MSGIADGASNLAAQPSRDLHTPVVVTQDVGESLLHIKNRICQLCGSRGVVFRRVVPERLSSCSPRCGRPTSRYTALASARATLPLTKNASDPSLIPCITASDCYASSLSIPEKSEIVTDASALLSESVSQFIRYPSFII